jgi:subtilisin family serine protease
MGFNLLLQFFLLFQTYSPTAPVDRWLVELDPDQRECLSEWKQRSGLEDIVLTKMPVDNWYALQVPASKSDEVRALHCIQRILPDSKIEWRDTEPNDPAFINQADMKLIGMPNAWDIATGGVTPRGDTIVVAIIDDGFDATHLDLTANIWFNHDELPDDEMDNDANGYVDDFMGYNVSTMNDQHPVSTHGTSVAGIIGARGNNSIGVSGVNWHVKLMFISGADFESELIMAYQYVYDMRELYNDSEGEKGAFVVATNLSGGVNFAWADDHPMWCGMYNTLGQLGILSVCSAPNQDISVDVEGDMPTTCTSPFMIAVTNVDLSDQLVGNAGYGPVSIDIGAPGNGTITTAPGNMFKSFPGTSSATPHVTGTVALMYSVPCETFIADIESNPEGVASTVRDIIFLTGKLNNSLEGMTLTGKRLQANLAVLGLFEDCQTVDTSKHRIISIRPNPVTQPIVEVWFELEKNSSGAYLELFSADGKRIFNRPITVEENLTGQMLLDTRSLPAALYFATLRDGDKKYTRRFWVP